MEFKSLAEDPDIDAIVWIGYPGPYGLYGVCEGLLGDVNPSGHLGDTCATNSGAAPSMPSSGKIPWTNAADFAGDENVNSYLVEAEGIYAGYRYYETRYNDIVTGQNDADASKASAGTYTGADYKVATTAGTWDYDHEVIYPFGYGLSYTTFEQTINSVSIPGDKRTATVSVTVKNTGDVAGKSVVQLYAQAPYTEYDKKNGVEKSAIQLMDFEKTPELKPGASTTITMRVDMANLASYDAYGAKTYIVEDGDYYFALGEDAHDALNNVLAAQGYDTEDGMTANGDADKVHKWTWGGGVDAETFSVSDQKVEITNKLTEGDYATDLNAFMPDHVTYLTRTDWDGTFPESYAGLAATGRLAELLKNDFIEIAQNEDTSEFLWGQESELTINDLKGAEFDDERWEELINKATIQEFLDYAGNSFHHIAAIPSVGLLDYDADDGPGGSDSHYFKEGQYQGEAWADANDEKYANLGTRVGQGQINLAYSWNKELAYENGEIILGETSLIFRLPIMIGPGMNIHRNGYNGRGGEYYSEDPILSGYIGSATIQGAQSKGCLVNIKHAAFNDSEINRSGIAVFMNEQKARELELRNLQQAFEGKGKPASFYEDEKAHPDAYTEGALGVMTSYNRIGAVASSANKAVMVDIMRKEWGFKGYNVTDFTGVSLKAAPKESILAGTTNFCGFGNSIDYWNQDYFIHSKAACQAVKDNLHYALYALANSNALNGINSTSYRKELMTSWRALYISLITIFSVTTVAAVAGYVVTLVLNRRKESN